MWGNVVLFKVFNMTVYEDTVSVVFWFPLGGIFAHPVYILHVPVHTDYQVERHKKASRFREAFEKLGELYV